MTKAKFPYHYLVVDISEEDETGFTAIIPKFPKLYIVADSVDDLHRAVQTMVEEEIQELKKKKEPVPNPDHKSKFSGKFVLRVEPVIHERLSLLAAAEGNTLNQFVNKVIKEKLS